VFGFEENEDESDFTLLLEANSGKLWLFKIEMKEMGRKVGAMRAI